MASNNKSQAMKLFEKYNLDLEDTYKSEKQSYEIVTRTGIEKIQKCEKISIVYHIVRAEKDYVIVKAVGTLPDGTTMETFGSAIKGSYETKEKTGKNGKKYNAQVLVGGSTNSWYVVEMAEKRAKSRVVLQLCGLYEYNVFGEDENPEDFQKSSEKNEVKVDNVIESIVNGDNK